MGMNQRAAAQVVWCLGRASPRALYKGATVFIHTSMEAETVK